MKALTRIGVALAVSLLATAAAMSARPNGDRADEQPDGRMRGHDADQRVTEDGKGQRASSFGSDRAPQAKAGMMATARRMGDGVSGMTRMMEMGHEGSRGGTRGPERPPGGVRHA